MIDESGIPSHGPKENAYKRHHDENLLSVRGTSTLRRDKARSYLYFSDFTGNS